MTVLLIIALVLMSLLIDYFVQRRQYGLAIKTIAQMPGDPLPLESDVKFAGLDEYFLPQGVFASSGHLWSLLMPSGKLRMGIDPLVAKMIGRIDQVIAPAKGQRIYKGDSLLKIKQGRRVMQFNSLIDGTIEEVNLKILEKPGSLNAGHPTNDWAVSIKPSGLSQAVKSMFVGDEARSWMQAELNRMREFLSGAAMQPAFAPTLPDGGLPAEGVLQQMDDNVWEAFQKEFLTPTEAKISTGKV
jgi:glycine cleavage system H lipoate-binding protein